VKTVPDSFSLTQSRCSHLSDPALRVEIRDHTGSEEATSAILRSIDRFGGDLSIHRFEITPSSRGYAGRGKNVVAWNVRAVRSEQVF
jgi:hypothetical protein